VWIIRLKAITQEGLVMKKKLLVIGLIVSLVVPVLYATDAVAEYKFTVKNSSKSKIVGLFAREAGKKEWGAFDVGSGIASGKTETMHWDASTNSSGCVWEIMAKYADGSSSAPAKFDFCKETDIEFTD